MKPTCELIDRAPRAIVAWQDEPGSDRLVLRRESKEPRVQASFEEYEQLHLGETPASSEPIETLPFVTHVTYWVALVHASLARVRELQPHSLYSAAADITFPHPEMQQIESFLRASRRSP